MMGENREWLAAKARIEERPFHSELPLIGPLIAGFRSLWNNVATRWYVRPLLDQQNEFNRILVERIQEQEGRLIALDREQTLLRHDLAENEAQLVHLQQRLQRAEEQLAQQPAAAREEEV